MYFLQIDTASLESSMQLQEENEHFRDQLQELQDMEQALKAEKDDLHIQLQVNFLRWLQPIKLTHKWEFPIFPLDLLYSH